MQVIEKFDKLAVLSDPELEKKEILFLDSEYYYLVKKFVEDNEKDLKELQILRLGMVPYFAGNYRTKIVKILRQGKFNDGKRLVDCLKFLGY